MELEAHRIFLELSPSKLYARTLVTFLGAPGSSESYRTANVAWQLRHFVMNGATQGVSHPRCCQMEVGGPRASWHARGSEAN